MSRPTLDAYLVRHQSWRDSTHTVDGPLRASTRRAHSRVGVQGGAAAAVLPQNPALDVTVVSPVVRPLCSVSWVEGGPEIRRNRKG